MSFSWQTVYLLTLVLFWSLFSSLFCNSGNKTKITLWWMHKQFATWVHTSFYNGWDAILQKCPVHHQWQAWNKPACGHFRQVQWVLAIGARRVRPQHFLRVARHRFYAVFNGSLAMIFMKSDQIDIYLIKVVVMIMKIITMIIIKILYVW